MPKFHDEEKLKQLLIDNNIPINDAVKRGKFYRENFDWVSYKKDYENGESIKDICIKSGLSYDTVRTNLKRVGTAFKEFKREKKSKYSFNNKNLFPMTNIGAYLMGWLYSDGSINDYRISLSLSKKDKTHLRYIADLFGSKDKELNEHKLCYEYKFYSVDLCKRLKEELNLLDRKSYKNFEIPFAKFTDKQLPYLLLGLFEGDGSISKDSLSCSFLITEKSWNSLKSRLLNKIDLSHINVMVISNYKLLRIDFTGISYYEFLTYIYNNTLEVKVLSRKFYRFLRQIERSMNGTTSPYKKLAVNIRCTLNRTLNDVTEM